MAITTEQLERWIDRHAVDKAAHRIGTVADIYLDDATGEPEWIAVMTGLFGSRISFVPLRGAREKGDDIQVAYDKSLVKDSPNVEADGKLSQDEEERLYRHYGIPYHSSAEDPEGQGERAKQNADNQIAGAASVGDDPAIETARLRLRKRDADSIDAIDLDSEEVFEKPLQPGDQQDRSGH